MLRPTATTNAEGQPVAAMANVSSALMNGIRYIRMPQAYQLRHRQDLIALTLPNTVFGYEACKEDLKALQALLADPELMVPLTQ